MSGFGGARAAARCGFGFGLALGTFLGSASARAEAPERNASLTISPIHLFLPVLELTAEVKVVPGFAVAAIGGFGSIAVESNDPTIDGDRFSVYEVGGQLLGYPLKPFDSLVVGAELLWLHVSVDDLGVERVSASGEGLAVGPLLGYKYIARGGFTLFAHGGVQYMALQAEAEGGGATNEAEDERFIPLINFNLGWSF